MNESVTKACLKDRITNGDRLLGLLVRVPSTPLIDMAGWNGFDFVLIDTEHGIADQKDLTEHLLAARAAQLPALVRIGAGEVTLALRVLDAGAEGIVVPHVQSAEEAEAAVRLAHYPPRGTRGMATYTWAGRWGQVAARDHADQAARRTVVLAMIEDAAGVENAAAIAATDGVDAVWVGPSDLTASLGYDADAADAARLRVWGDSAGQQTPVLAIVADAAGARRAWDKGAQLLLLNAQAAIDEMLRDWARSV